MSKEGVDIPEVAECVLCHSVIRWKDTNWGEDPELDRLVLSGWGLCYACQDTIVASALTTAEAQLKMGILKHSKEWKELS